MDTGCCSSCKTCTLSYRHLLASDHIVCLPCLELTICWHSLLHWILKHVSNKTHKVRFSSIQNFAHRMSSAPVNITTTLPIQLKTTTPQPYRQQYHDTIQVPSLVLDSTLFFFTPSPEVTTCLIIVDLGILNILAAVFFDTPSMTTEQTAIFNVFLSHLA